VKTRPTKSTSSNCLDFIHQTWKKKGKKKEKRKKEYLPDVVKIQVILNTSDIISQGIAPIHREHDNSQRAWYH
jgi:hypothetical protein